MDIDISNNLVEQIKDAFDSKSTLRISAGNTKSFYGNPISADTLDVSKHQGILEYQPSELVITVRSGTKLSDLEAELQANNQMLAFEPPQHDENTTIGGVIACGMSGPRRVAAGSARDFVLGTTIINGKAEKLKFGGQVMKNVAGYDASRLMVGAQGTLGLILEISLKILPVSESEISLKIPMDRQEVTSHIQQWIRQGLPVSASCFYKNILYLRLSSTLSAVKQSHKTINDAYANEEIDNTFWLDVKNQRHTFFDGTKNLWRFSHHSASELLDDHEDQFIEWNGALIWIDSADELHTLAEKHEANATRYPLNTSNEHETTELFQPLQPGLLKIHKNMKRAFDPQNILNPGRIYADL